MKRVKIVILVVIVLSLLSLLIKKEMRSISSMERERLHFESLNVRVEHMLTNKGGTIPCYYLKDSSIYCNYFLNPDIRRVINEGDSIIKRKGSNKCKLVTPEGTFYFDCYVSSK